MSINRTTIDDANPLEYFCVSKPDHARKYKPEDAHLLGVTSAFGAQPTAWRAGFEKGFRLTDTPPPWAAFVLKGLTPGQFIGRGPLEGDGFKGGVLMFETDAAPMRLEDGTVVLSSDDRYYPYELADRTALLGWNGRAFDPKEKEKENDCRLRPFDKERSYGNALDYGRAAMVLTKPSGDSGGLVFSAGTIGWNIGLQRTGEGETPIQTITRNLIVELAAL
jgi:hypothetical protein